MKYFLEPQGDDRFAIVNYHSDCNVGYVALRDARYHVRNTEADDVAIVDAIDECIPAFAAYYEANPPRWKPEGDDVPYSSVADAPGRRGARYIKETQFGPLWVDEIKPGQWLAYRNDHELLIDGKIATFAAREDAQAAADAHLRDGYPNFEVIDDGFLWQHDPNIEWWLCPFRVAARWQSRTANLVGLDV